MMLETTLLTLLLTLQPWHEDAKRETPGAREARLGVVAQSVARAADLLTCRGSPDGDKCERKWRGSRETLAVMLVNLGWWESRYALHVHQNRCRVLIGECDAGRARSPWQLQISRQVEWRRWMQIAGTSRAATNEAAHAAADVFAMAHARCKNMEGAIAMYATGKRCKWKRAADRMAHYRKLLARFEELRDAEKGARDDHGRNAER